MTAPEILRQLATPQTAAVFTAAADALDERTRLLATIAGLETTVAEQAARILELEKTQPQPARFPGDPGPGRIVIGCVTSNGNVARIVEHEQAVRRPVGARRRYRNAGPADLAAPTGPVAAWIAEDVKAGREPVISVKLGRWADTAAGRHDTAIRGLVRFVEGQAGYVKLLHSHEPENDHVGLTDAAGKPKGGQLGTAAEFRAAQTRWRKIITEVTGGRPKRISFGGSLMTYTWTDAARRGGLKPPDDWFPGPGVWDWCGLDHYTDSGAPIFSQKWTDAVATVQRWGVPVAVCELGIRREDPGAAGKLAAMHARLLELGAPFLHFYDSNVNSTGTGWEMTGPLLDTFRQLLAEPRTVTPNRR